MKAYKIDLSMYEGKIRELISEAVQKKAFELGYEWLVNGKTVFPERDKFNCLSNGNITQGAYFGGYGIISAADFLALTTAKDAPVFKPFDKVLAMDEDDEAWMCDLFSHMDGDDFTCVGTYWKQCIPHEGNEHLVGTTDKPNS